MMDAAGNTSMVLGFVSSVVVYFWIHRWRQRDQLGPKTWPYFGNLLEIRANAARLNDWIYDYMSKSPTATVKAYILSSCSIFTGYPDNVEHILKSHFSNYIKGPQVIIKFGNLLGIGIFTADGDVWKQHRKLASYEFSSMKLREVSTNAYREHALRLLAFLDPIADSQKQVDIQDLFLRMTIDSICTIGFGVDQHILSADLPDIPFAKAFDTLSQCSVERSFDPTWQMKRMLNIDREKEFKALLSVLDNFTYGVVKKRRAELDRLQAMNKTLDNHDLLSRFMSAKDENGNPLSEKTLRDAVLNFMIAGRDTSAVTLSWFVYALSGNPEVAEKINQELNEVLGEKEEEDIGQGRDRFSHFADLLTYESLGKLPYLHAALTETVRLFPAVARDGKFAINDDVLPDGTTVKAGSIVIYVPYAMGRLELLWGPDASQFRPERWLKDNTFQAESPYKFSAFQMTAALLVRYFRIQMVPKQNIIYNVSLVMSIHNGLKATLQRR